MGHEKLLVTVRTSRNGSTAGVGKDRSNAWLVIRLSVPCAPQIPISFGRLNVCQPFCVKYMGVSACLVVAAEMIKIVVVFLAGRAILWYRGALAGLLPCRSTHDTSSAQNSH